MSEQVKKNILIGLTGSIALYKTIEIIRQLKKTNKDINIKVVMSASAKKFIQPLMFAAISENEVYDDLFQFKDGPMEHIELARWADEIWVVPASANFIAKTTSGLAFDLLGNIILAATVPIYIVPAMNMHMWQNSIVQENIIKLRQHKYNFIGPESGEQACGDIGEGRMVDPEAVVKLILNNNLTKTNFKFKNNKLNVVITAGPTIEAIDPVRYISNHSSGKMGYSLASAFVELGANVTLISGPTNLEPPINVTVIKVKSANDMLLASQEQLGNMDVFIAAAAVADYKAAEYSIEKIKKELNDKKNSLKLVKTVDILKTISFAKQRPFCIGFAAETDNIIENALNKLKNKNLDLLILNQIDKNNGFPFHADENEVMVFNKTSDDFIKLPRQNKKELAKALLKKIMLAYQA